MEITTEMIKELRNATKAGVLDCRKALTEADGDFQKAVDWLREKGMATAAKRADRDASQGVVELYSHGGGRVGVMVEVNCESDFVARSEQFRQLAHEIALQIAASAPRYLKVEDIPADVLEHEAGIARARANMADGDAMDENARDARRLSDETLMLFGLDERLAAMTTVLERVAVALERCATAWER